MTEALLDRARDGDGGAFAALVAPLRRELHVHCYRMLGSVTDAEDLLQETLTAAWRGIDGLADPSALRAWLYRIATNRCLNAIRSHKRRPPPVPDPVFAVPEPSRHREVTWLQPYPDAWLAELHDRDSGPAAQVEQADTMRLAFIELLQRMPPRQAAALLLVDLLHFTRAETAEMLGASPAALKGLLQRARQAMPAEPGNSSGALPAEDEDLARRFASAFAADDLDCMLALLTDDAWLAMPPAPHEYRGRAAIARFLTARAAREPSVVRITETGANGQLAFLLHWDHGSSSLLCVTARSGRVEALTHFLTANLADWPEAGRAPTGRSRTTRARWGVEPSRVKSRAIGDASLGVA